MSETPSIGAAFPTAPSRLSRSFKAARMQFRVFITSPSPYHLDWWEYVMEYSKDINALLGNPKSNDSSLIEDPEEVLKVKHLLLHGSHQLDQLGYREWTLLFRENVSQTNILLNKLQELSMASVRPGFVTVDLPAEALDSDRLALATTLGRAILEEQ